MLAANAQFDVGAHGPAALGSDADQVADNLTKTVHFLANTPLREPLSYRFIPVAGRFLQTLLYNRLTSIASNVPRDLANR